MSITITNEERINKFKNANSAQAYFYSDPEAGVTFKQIFDTEHLDSDSYIIYMTTVGDVILGFHSLNDLQNQLQDKLQLEETITHRISTKILEYLRPLRTDSNDVPLVSESNNNIYPSASEPIPSLLQVDIQAEHLDAVRTMAKDMHDLQHQAPHEPNTHQSLQADALKRN